MAEDVIDILIDRAKIAEDVEFLAKEAQKALDIIKAMKMAYVEVSKASSFEELNKEIKEFTNLEKLAADAAKDYNKAVQAQKVDMEQAAKALSTVSKTVEDNIKINLQNKASLKDVQDTMKALKKEIEAGNDANGQRAAMLQQLAKEELLLKQTVSDTTTTLKSQIKEVQAAPTSYDAMNATLGQLRNAFRKLSEEERNGDIGQTLLTSISELDTELKAIDGSMGNFQRNVGNYAGSFSAAFDVLKDELTQVTQKLNGMDESSTGFAELKQQQELLLQVTSGLNKQYGSTKQELRSLEEAAQQLAGAWGLNNTKVQEFVGAVGGIKDDLQDVKDSIKLSASDTGGFDRVINAAEGVTGAFAVAEGAAALFGGENEELQKTLTRLNAVMTILNGLQAIQNELKNKDSIFRKLLIRDTAVQIAATGAATAATTAQTAATGGLTVAQRLFNFVAKLNPIGLIITAITVVVGLIVLFKDKLLNLIPGLKGAYDSVMGLVDAFTDFIGITSEADRALEKNIAALEKHAKKQEDILKYSGSKYDEYTKKKIQANIDFTNKDKDLTEELRKGSITQAQYEQFRKDAREGANKEIIAADNERIAKQQEGIDKQNKIEEDARKKSSDEAKKRADELAAIQKKENESAFELSQLKMQALADANDRIFNEEKNDFGTRLIALNEFGKTTAAIIEAEKKHLLENKQLTKSEREVIEFNAQSKLDELARNGAASRKLILDAELEELKKYGEQLESDGSESKQTNVEVVTTNTVQDVTKLIVSQEDNYNKDIIKLNELLSTKKISLEEYEAARKQLDEDSSLAIINNQIALNEALIGNLSNLVDAEGNKYADIAEYEKELTRLKKEQSDLQLKDTKEKTAEEQKLAEQKNAALKKLGEDAFNFTQTLVLAGFENEKNRVQENIDLITKETAHEIAAVNASALSQQEKADKITAINITAQSKKEQLEARQREIENKKAKAERLFQIFRIVGNTAEAITKAVAASPLTGGMPFAAIAGAIGAIQLATLLATPIPKYKDGTEFHIGGAAIVGDGGKRELAITPSGDMFVTPDTPTLVNLQRGTKVLPDYDKYMSEMQLAMLGQNLQTATTPINTNDYQSLQIKMLENQLAANNNELIAVRKSVENLTIHSTSLTEGGFEYGVKKGLTKIKHIDNYFKN